MPRLTLEQFRKKREAQLLRLGRLPEKEAKAVLGLEEVETKAHKALLEETAKDFQNQFNKKYAEFKINPAKFPKYEFPPDKHVIMGVGSISRVAIKNIEGKPHLCIGAIRDIEGKPCLFHGNPIPLEKGSRYVLGRFGNKVACAKVGEGLALAAFEIKDSAVSRVQAFVSVDANGHVHIIDVGKNRMNLIPVKE